MMIRGSIPRFSGLNSRLLIGAFSVLSLWGMGQACHAATRAGQTALPKAPVVVTKPVKQVTRAPQKTFWAGNDFSIGRNRRIDRASTEFARRKTLETLAQFGHKFPKQHAQAKAQLVREQQARRRSPERKPLIKDGKVVGFAPAPRTGERRGSLYRPGDFLRRGERLLNQTPYFRRGMTRARGAGRTTRGSVPVRTNNYTRTPTLSLPIGLPSIDIAHVPGATWTSNAKVQYRTIGAPAPGLGAGNLVRSRGKKNP